MECLEQSSANCSDLPKMLLKKAHQSEWDWEGYSYLNRSTHLFFLRARVSWRQFSHSLGIGKYSTISKWFTRCLYQAKPQIIYTSVAFVVQVIGSAKGRTHFFRRCAK